jgi:hypothetical protein
MRKTGQEVKRTEGKNRSNRVAPVKPKGHFTSFFICQENNKRDLTAFLFVAVITTVVAAVAQ